ncbi:unnamed protein product [Peniophora sp. CBMAI 1063]|nr:unnamed protein product [Peniophora sp. CBMAI 1063]
MTGSTRRPGMLSGEAYIRRVPSPFSLEQILAYCTKIGLNEVHDAASLQSFEPNLANLGRLQFLHNLAFPQDVSDLHYTKEHHMPVTPHELYQSMVLDGKGSYCFGQNGLFLGILRGLGYRAYGSAGRVLVPSRVSPDGPMVYSGLDHYVILVQPLPAPRDNITFVVDVGFGGTGLVRPLLLADASAGDPQAFDTDLKGGWVWGSYPPERHRILQGSFPESSLETALGSGEAPLREWHFQVSHAPRLHPNPDEPEWRTLFTFTEDEFFLADIEEASFCVSNMPRFIFNNTVICTRRIEVALERDEDEEEAKLWGGTHEEKWLAKWNLQGGQVTLRAGSRVLEERTVATERERLEVLKDVFGVNVTPEDEQWMKGRLAALPTA